MMHREDDEHGASILQDGGHYTARPHPHLPLLDNHTYMPHTADSGLRVCFRVCVHIVCVWVCVGGWGMFCALV